MKIIKKNIVNYGKGYASNDDNDDGDGNAGVFFYVMFMNTGVINNN